MEYRLNLNTFHLHCGDKNIALTLIEAGILEILMRWPDHVKSHSEFLSAAWPDDTDALETSVRERIVKIRKKARGAFGCFDAIETIYGVGYIFKGKAVVVLKSDNSETVTFPCEWVPRPSVDELGRRQWDCAVCAAKHLSLTPPDRCLKAYKEYKIERLADAKIRRTKMENERIKDAPKS